MMSKALRASLLGGMVMLAAACSGAVAEPPASPQPPAPPATPDAPPKPAPPPDIKRAATPNACEAVHGTCMPMGATVACKSSPAGLCNAGEICCVM